jgi:CRP/FNR family cyclic AMP-dependent transcriptional regulator
MSLKNKESESAMRGPYDLELSANCLACKCRGNGFFCQLSPAELKDFDAIKYVSVYRADAVLFVREQKPRGMYVLCKGQVKLSFSSSEGKTLILRIAGPGEVLGLVSTLTGDPYEVTAETVRPCQVAFVSTNDFQQFLRKHPAVFGRVASHLAPNTRVRANNCVRLALALRYSSEWPSSCSIGPLRGEHQEMGLRSRCR